MKINNKKFYIGLLISMGFLASLPVLAIEEMEPPVPFSSLNSPFFEPPTPQIEISVPENENELVVKEITIEGNNLIKEEEILKLIKTKKGDKFNRNNIAEDLRAIYQMGFFTRNLKATPKVTKNGVVLKLKVEENVPVTGFIIKGNEVIEALDIMKAIEYQIGKPQNMDNINSSIAKIEEMYAEKGYILARVKGISENKDGTVIIDINEGVINSINIEGNDRTKEYVIKRNILVEPGSVYNENLLRADLSRIYGTRAFDNVRRDIVPSEDNPDVFDLTIAVEEKRTGVISIGGGVDTANGFFGDLGFSDTNFRGRGQSLSLKLMSGSGVVMNDSDILNRANYQLELTFIEPRYKQSMNSLQVRAYGRDFASYQVPLAIERKIGGEIEVAHPFETIPHLAGIVSVGIEGVDVREGDLAEIQNIYTNAGVNFSERANQLVTGTLISIGPSLVYDTRDNILNPRSGIYTRTGYKASFGLGDIDTFGKVSTIIKKYYPVGKLSTFTLKAKAGTNIHGEMPEFAAFRLGGASTIRGFRQGNVGIGKGYAMTSAEMKTPIPFMNRITKIAFFNNLRSVLFIDAGTMFNETITNTLYDRPGYGVSAGMGLRVYIPGLGPLNLDYGIPLTTVGANNSKSGKFTFEIGELY